MSFKVNKNITEGLINIDNAKITKPTKKSIGWNPNEYEIESIDTKKGEIVLRILEDDSDE